MGSSIIHELGDPEGFAVVCHNGTPCSRLLPEWWDAPARERGLRMIGIDRAGYGNAPAEPDRSLRSVAESTAALMDELGVDRFALIGTSGGGPYALACGAFLSERVVGGHLRRGQFWVRQGHRWRRLRSRGAGADP